MHLLNNSYYLQDLEYVAELPLEWDRLKRKSILISGASGMIGSFLIDVLMYKNRKEDLDCRIYALGRNSDKARKRFNIYWENDNFFFLCRDINQGLVLDANPVDFVFHAASNTHPIAYASDPIGTVMTNVLGTYHMLEFAAEHCADRVIFASSVEIYGENRGDCDKFSEDYCGYINCNTLRAGYPESKRAGEALCQAYVRQKGLDIVIPRLARTYGPTMLMSDTKAISQFIKKGVAREDIVLKSEGTQFYSYNYVADAVSGILYCLLKGRCGETYNISDVRSDISLRDLAKIIADYTGKKVVYELPDEVESAGYSKATRAVLDSGKLQQLGWKAGYDMKSGIERTLCILSK